MGAFAAGHFIGCETRYAQLAAPNHSQTVRISCSYITLPLCIFTFRLSYMSAGFFRSVVSPCVFPTYVSNGRCLGQRGTWSSRNI